MLNPVMLAVAVATVLSFGAFAGSEYRFAEFIERNTSSTINTGVKITANTTKVEFGVQDSLGETANSDKKLMGDSSEKFGFATLGGRWRVLSQSYSQGGPGKDTTRIDVTVTGSSSGTSWKIVRADGVSGDLTQSKFYASGKPLYIFGLGGSVGAPAGFRFFYMRHYETIGGVEKLSNFVVPAERLSDHKAGLYDIVTGSFFAPSSGTPVLSESASGELADVLEIAGTPTARGTVTPAYGVHVGYPAGTPVVATSSATWQREDGEAVATCVGYKVYTNGVEWMSGAFTGDEVRTVSFTRPECAEGVKLEWLWDEQCHVTVNVSGGGSIRGETDFWTTAGNEITVEALPADGYSFENFTGDIPDERVYDNPMTITAVGPTAITAHFAKGMSSPTVVRQKSIFWLDAMNDSTILCDENNLVTNWISRANGPEKRATVPDGCLAPTNDTTHYDIATVDFGKVSSNIDMVFPAISDVRTIFFAVKIAKTRDAFLIGDSVYYKFHRGNGGEYGVTIHCPFDKVWDLGNEVPSWASTAIPSDSFRVIAIRTKSDCAISSLTRDRNGIDNRSGGKQLSELIVFNEALDDSQIATVNTYLMRKWGFAEEKIAVVGSPDTYAGYPSPFYGDHAGYAAGDAVTFSLPSSVFTNDSQTFETEMTGWTFIDSDGNKTEGTGTETSMTYGEPLMYSTFTWNWSGAWTRVNVKAPRPPKLPALYREVEYLETGANGSIATGIKLTTATSEVAFRFGVSDDVAYPSGDADDSKWFGAATDYDKTMFSFGHYRGMWRILARHEWNSPACYSSSRGPLDVVIRGKSWSFLNPADGTYSRQTATYPLVGETDSANAIGIFGGTGLRAPAGVRFYGMRIWERGVLVHDLVPCYQRRDAETRQLLETPVPGVYDRVTGEFKAGTGAIACGPEVAYPGLAIRFR